MIFTKFLNYNDFIFNPNNPKMLNIIRKIAKIYS